PGLTHDEADHGLSAWQVVEGARPLYFTVGYGREPLYDYATAGLMSFLGPTDFALRLTAVFFSLIMLSATYAWVRRAFNERIALLTLAGLTVNFWSLMVARHGLRTITLPALFTLAMALWWPKSYQLSAISHRLDSHKLDSHRLDSHKLDSHKLDSPVHNSQFTIHNSQLQTPWLQIITAGLLLGLSFYTYMPARLLWLLFPGMLLWWLLTNRPKFRRYWPSTAVMLAIAVLVALPLFNYLSSNPEAELRIGQLRGPLDAAAAGDWQPLQENIVAGLKTISIANSGDTAWRYNIAGRPFLNSFSAFFFYMGIGFSLWQIWRALYHGRVATAESYIAVLAWLLIGLAPVLITGPFLSVTRAVGMMPVLFVFPAIAIDFIWRVGLTGERALNYGTPAVLTVLFVYLMTGFESAQSYFFEWATHPEVRLQYEAGLVDALDYVKQNSLADVALSTTTPDRYHNQPVGLLTLNDPDEQLRWFNGQASLLIPSANPAHLVWTGLAARPEPLEPYWQAAASQTLTELPLPEDDIDRPITITAVDGVAWQTAVTAMMQSVPTAVQFGEAVTLRGYAIPDQPLQAGGTLTVLTLWRIERPLDAEMVLFTQLLGADGTPIAQQDRLDVPSNRWQAGDLFIQMHQLSLPANTPAGTFPLIVGFYDAATCPACQRLAVTIDQQPAGDFYELTRVTMSNEQ
ncbi:MAG: glycosyltransferase family 39 protein, partial [Anaerolineales bacterium]|nr:glycosyltransferase family 39 protein [Anaerolineales bacterium]